MNEEDADLPRRIPNTAWEDHKETITDLYLGDGRSLKEVMDVMRTRHNFHASSAQYKNRMSLWGVSKNTKRQDVVRPIERARERADAASRAPSEAHRVSVGDVANSSPRYNLTQPTRRARELADVGSWTSTLEVEMTDQPQNHPNTYRHTHVADADHVRQGDDLLCYQYTFPPAPSSQVLLHPPPSQQVSLHSPPSQHVLQFPHCNPLHSEMTWRDSTLIEPELEPPTTALQAACAGGHTAVVRMLINAGADVNSRASAAGTPLTSAIAAGHTKIAEMLIREGADVNINSMDSPTPLAIAALSGNEELVRLLIEHNADVNKSCPVYGNPLQAAAGKGHMAVVSVLLEEGAEVNAFTTCTRPHLQQRTEPGIAQRSVSPTRLHTGGSTTAHTCKTCGKQPVVPERHAIKPHRVVLPYLELLRKR